MLESFYFSIAGKKANPEITQAVFELASADYIPELDKKLLKHTLEVAEGGIYPSSDYYKRFYEVPDTVTKNKAEILLNVKNTKDFYQREDLIGKLNEAANETYTYKDLVERVSLATDSTAVSDVDDLDKFKPQTYSDTEGDPHQDGIYSGISEIDDLTYGFMRGTVASVCAFTGHGKSQTWLSILYKNAKEKKNCVLMSLEVSPELVWLMIQARYLHEEKGMDVTSTDLIHRKLTKENADLVRKYDEDFKKDICSHLLVCDESIINKGIITDYRQISRLFSKFEKVLGGLDLVVWDHVHQLELMFPTLGNIGIRSITSATKTWYNQQGVHIVTGLAVQCNREGEKRARKRNGLYDLQAIGDLNEVERSSSYLVFLYTSEESKIVQETKVCMLKQRLGQVLVEPATVSFNPAISTVGSTVQNVAGVGEFDFDGSGESFDDTGDFSADAFGDFDI